MLFVCLSSHFTNSLIPTCDSYKCCVVALLRLGEEKKRAESWRVQKRLYICRLKE